MCSPGWVGASYIQCGVHSMEQEAKQKTLFESLQHVAFLYRILKTAIFYVHWETPGKKLLTNVNVPRSQFQVPFSSIFSSPVNVIFRSCLYIGYILHE